MKNFFQRPKTQDYEKTFVPFISKFLNLENIGQIKRRKVIDLYSQEYKNDFLAYRFDLLNEWIKQNNNYSKEFIVALVDMIDRLVLFNELNSYEQQFIKNTQAVVFAKSRNLKQLIVDFSVNKNELVFYRYPIDSFRQVDKKGLVQKINEPEIYFTTQRIIIAKQLDIISLTYDQIKEYKYIKGKFSLGLANGKKCYIVSDNNRALYESLQRVIKKEKIQLK